MLIKAWNLLLTFIVLWSLVASALAKLGLFLPGLVLISVLFCALLSAGLWMRDRENSSFCLREGILLSVLILFASVLFALPAEHYPLLGDSAIYPNTAAVLARNGGLTYTYAPFAGLTNAQKELFYLPVARQPSVTKRSYEGMINGAFYLTDTSQNTVVASRQPVVYAWMGMAALFFNPQATLWILPIFGVLGVLALYFWGRQVFTPRVGGIAALWLLASFPQIHFSRAPYAEVVGQVLLLGALYAWVTYLGSRQPRYLMLGYGALAAAFSSRIDSILALGTLVFLLLILAWQRDGRGLLISGMMTPVVIGISVALWSYPYVSATHELMMNYQLRFLESTSPFLLGGGFIIALGAVSAGLWSREYLIGRFSRLRRWWRVAGKQFLYGAKVGGSTGFLLLVGYALYLRPLQEEYTLIHGQVYRTHNEELLLVAAQYVTPLLIWLAALGVVAIIALRRPRAAQLLSVFFLLSFSLPMFWRYTSARVYPVALRRLVSDVLPGICTIGAFALEYIRKVVNRRWASSANAALAGGVFVILFSVWPNYWFYHEAQGAWAVIAEVDRALPADAVILFEPQEQDRIAGWWATPLWAFKQRDALVLNPWFDENVGVLDAVVCHWQQSGRDVYLMTQRDPEDWWPLSGSIFELTYSVAWDSSIVGQSRAFPPAIWRFAFQFHLYHLRGTCGEGL